MVVFSGGRQAFEGDRCRGGIVRPRLPSRPSIACKSVLPPLSSHFPSVRRWSVAPAALAMFARSSRRHDVTPIYLAANITSLSAAAAAAAAAVADTSLCRCASRPSVSISLSQHRSPGVRSNRCVYHSSRLITHDRAFAYKPPRRQERKRAENYNK